MSNYAFILVWIFGFFAITLFICWWGAIFSVRKLFDYAQEAKKDFSEGFFEYIYCKINTDKEESNLRRIVQTWLKYSFISFIFVLISLVFIWCFFLSDNSK